MVKRKNRSEILDAIYNAIPVNSTLPIYTIAHKADIAPKTAQGYIDMIMKIQKWPSILQEKIGEQTGYRRETQAGRPRKR